MCGVSSGKQQNIHLTGEENAEKRNRRGGLGGPEELGLSPGGSGESWGAVNS